MYYRFAPAELTPFRNPCRVFRNRRLCNRNKALFDLNRRRRLEKWLPGNAGFQPASIYYTYDGNNNLLSVIDTISGVNYEYRYDELNRKVYQYVNSAELDVPVEFTYTYNTQAKTITETLSGLIDGVINDYYTNVFQYDTFNNLIGITQTGTNLTTKTVDYVYNRNGQRTGATYKQAGETVSNSNWAYDAANRISSIQHKSAADSVFAEYGFTWDAANRITEFETVDGTADYTYDATGQLTGADYDYQGGGGFQSPEESYSYDANGNRTLTGYVTGDNNELSSDGSWNYDYDAEGNRISKTNSTSTERELYEWDYRNRLTRVTAQTYDSITESWTTVQIVEYAYDYNNVLIRKMIDTDGNGTMDSKTLFLPENYQTAIQLDDSDLSDSTGPTVSHRYLWTPGQQDKLLADVTTNDILWSLTDHLGTVRDIIQQTPSGIITKAHIIYDAYGNVLSCKDSNGTDIESPVIFGYTGKYFDADTQLQNNVNRWYDATTGRWLSIDPIGFNGNDTNLYRYVGNRISLYTDYKGLQGDFFEYIVSTAKDVVDKIDRTGGQLIYVVVTWEWDTAGVSSLSQFGYANMQGAIQGGANIANGIQDSVIGIINVPIMFTKTFFEEVELISSPDWSRNLIVQEGGKEGTWSDSHGWSKFIGGEGAMTLLTFCAGNLRHVSKPTALYHYTNPSAKLAIEQSKTLVGKGGIFALDAENANSIFRTLVYPKPTETINITGAALEGFRPIPVVGPISTWTNINGGYVNYVSKINLVTGQAEGLGAGANSIGLFLDISAGQTIMALPQTSQKLFESKFNPFAPF